MSARKTGQHKEPDQEPERDELDPNGTPDTDEETSGETDSGAPSVDELAAAAAEAESELNGGSELRADLERLQQEAAEAQDRYLRTYAEFENYRKRSQRDLAEFRKYANEQMAQDLLTVLDHLGLALKHAKDAGGAGQGLQEGVELVHKQFGDTLEKYGVKPFKSEGEPFDPKLHDAMIQVETADVPENTVVQVFQDGYLYHEKVLRHARVGVSKRPAVTSAETPEAAAAGGDDLEPE